MGVFVCNFALRKPMKHVDLEIIPELISECLVRDDIRQEQIVDRLFSAE